MGPCLVIWRPYKHAIVGVSTARPPLGVDGELFYYKIIIIIVTDNYLGYRDISIHNYRPAHRGCSLASIGHTVKRVWHSAAQCTEVPAELTACGSVKLQHAVISMKHSRNITNRISSLI